jgi:hypothetical protein
LALLWAVVFLFPASLIAIAVPWVLDFIKTRILNVHKAFEEIFKRFPGKNWKAFYQPVKKSDTVYFRKTNRIN